MLMTLACLIDSKKWIIPAAAMYAPSPVFFTAIQALQIAKPILPTNVFETLDQTLWASYQKMILFFFETYTGVEVEISGDFEEIFDSTSENAVVLSNHQCTVDWIVMDMLAARQSSLGRMRYILKDSLKYIPLFGLYFWQHSCVNVGRYGTFSEEKTVKQLAYLKDRKLSTWMGIFPEGTRYNPDKQEIIQKSKSFAKSKGMSELQNVLTPRIKATQLALKYMQSHIAAVYDVTIAYSSTRLIKNGNPSRQHAQGMADFLNTRNPSVHIHIRRFYAKDIPLSQTDLQQWMHKLFEEKDKMMTKFYDTGSLTDSCTVRSQLPTRKTLPSAIVCIGSALAVLSHSTGRGLYWKIALGGTIFSVVFMGFH